MLLMYKEKKCVKEGGKRKSERVKERERERIKIGLMDPFVPLCISSCRTAGF